MESSKELIGKITKEKDMVVDVINNVVDRLTNDLEDASTVTREQFIDYCKNQVTAEDKVSLMSDVQSANPDAVSEYYYDRVENDSDYMSVVAVDDDYIKCSEITADFIKDNFDGSILEGCMDLALEDLASADENRFVSSVMNHLNASVARKLILEIIDSYM